MQNKYKLENHIRMQAIWTVRGYEAEKKKYLAERAEILALGSQKYYESFNENARNDEEKTERVYIKGGTGTSSPTEQKALRLLALDGSFAGRTVKAVEDAVADMRRVLARSKERDKIITALLESCKQGRKFNIDYAGIQTIRRSQFYNYRQMFLYFVAKKRNFF